LKIKVTYRCGSKTEVKALSSFEELYNELCHVKGLREYDLSVIPLFVARHGCYPGHMGGGPDIKVISDYLDSVLANKLADEAGLYVKTGLNPYLKADKQKALAFVKAFDKAGINLP